MPDACPESVKNPPCRTAQQAVTRSKSKTIRARGSMWRVALGFPFFSCPSCPVVPFLLLFFPQIGSGLVRGGPQIRFRPGSTRVPPGFHQDSTRVPPGFHQGSTRGSTRISPGFHQFSTRVPPEFHQGWTRVPPAFHEVLPGLRGGARTRKSIICCWGCQLRLFGKGSPLTSTNQTKKSDALFPRGNPLGIGVAMKVAPGVSWAPSFGRLDHVDSRLVSIPCHERGNAGKGRCKEGSPKTVSVFGCVFFSGGPSN